VNTRALLVLLVVLVLAIGAYVVYQNERDDVEIELPDVDINE
jgi:uncharacterized protein (UPF0333 family)